MTETELPPGAYAVVLHCRACGAEIHTHTDANMSEPFVAEMTKRFMKMALCRQCHEESSTREARLAQRQRGHAWEQVCPIEFRKIDHERLPAPKKFDQVQLWQYGPRGLVLHGPTGRGKSMAAWSLCTREFMSGRNVQVVDANFGSQYQRKVNAHGLADWLEEKMKADLLLMDDVFKVRLSDGVETALFAIMEEMVSGNRPLIVTTNDTGETLKARLSPDRGDPIIRRLREKCAPISFQ